MIDTFSFLGDLLFSLSCFGIVIVLGYAFLRLFSNNQSSHRKTTQTKNLYTMKSFLHYLKDLKQEGAKTIDQVIEDVTQKVAREEDTQALELVSEISNDQYITTTPAPQQSNPTKYDTATVLLYLGAVLFLFAIVVFALFSWQNFSTVSQLLLISLVPAVFFAVGFAIRKREQFSQAATTFLVISAITIGLAGIGIWNFIDIEALVPFWQYWGYFSLVATLLYFAFSQLLPERQYKFFFLVALYSLSISVIMAQNTSPEMRLVLLALSNCGLAALVSYIPDFTEIGQKSMRLVNMSIDGVALVLLFLGMYESSTLLPAVLLLGIPFLVNGYWGLVKNKKTEKMLVYATFVPKIWLLLGVLPGVFSASVVTVIVALSISFAVLSLEFYVKKYHNDELYSPAWRWHLLLSLLLLVVSTNWTGKFELVGYVQTVWNVGAPAFLFSSIVLSGAYAVSYLQGSFGNKLGIVLVPLLFSLLSLVTTELFVITLVTTSVIALLLGASFLTKHIASLANYSITASVFTFVVAMFEKENFLLGILLAMTVVVFGVTCMRIKKDSLLWLTLPLIALAMNHVNAITSSYSLLEGIPFLVPILVSNLLVLAVHLDTELDHSDSSLRDSILMKFSVFAALGGVLATWHTYETSLWVLVISVLFMIAWQLIEKSRLWEYAIPPLLLAGFWQFLRMLGVEASLTYLLIALLLAFSQQIIRLVKESTSQVLSLATYSRSLAAVGLFILLLLLQYLSREYFANSVLVYVSLASVFITMSIFVSQVGDSVKKLGGVGIVFALWYIGVYSDWLTQGYIIPITLYLLTLAYYEAPENKGNRKLFEVSAVLLQLGSLFIQSARGSDENQLFYSILLIVLSTGTIILGNQLEKTHLVKIGSAMLALIFIVRLWSFITIIPWWLLVAVFGLLLMGASMYSSWKKA